MDVDEQSCSNCKACFDDGEGLQLCCNARSHNYHATVEPQEWCGEWEE
jgi:hypothetical protein